MKKLLFFLVFLGLISSTLAENVIYNGSPTYNQTGDLVYNGSVGSYNTSLIILNTSINNSPNNTSANDINSSNGTGNNGSWWPQLPEVNKTDLENKLKNITTTGVSSVDDITKFLTDASPYLVLIIGGLLFIFAGFAKLIGIILIVIALIKILWGIL